MEKQKLTRFERYLQEEIGIEFKACLYFFCILFFYSMWKIAGGNWQAGILHMGEMILSTYGMGYMQVWLLSNFDEGEQMGVREVGYMVLCAGIYTGVAVLCKWFDGIVGMAIAFYFYMLFVYICAFLVYKIKRDLDTRVLNEDLKNFQTREGVKEEGRGSDE